MKLGLKKLIDGSELSLQFDEKVEVDKDRVGEHVENPVRVAGTVYAGSEDGALTGKLYYTYKDACARCLKDTEVQIEEDLDLALVRGNSELDSAEDSVAAYNEDEIFIEDYLADIILATSPMKVVCSEDCKGLCPVCGANLNEETCDCEIDNVDPRLAKLKELFD